MQVLKHHNPRLESIWHCSPRGGESRPKFWFNTKLHKAKPECRQKWDHWGSFDSSRGGEHESGAIFRRVLFCLFLRSIGRKKVFFNPSTFLRHHQNLILHFRRIGRSRGVFLIAELETVRKIPNVAPFASHWKFLFLLKVFSTLQKLRKQNFSPPPPPSTSQSTNTPSPITNRTSDCYKSLTILLYSTHSSTLL